MKTVARKVAWLHAMAGSGAVIAVCAFVAASPSAARTLDLIENAYELKMANVSFPTSTFDNLGFRSCNDCDAQTLAVSPETRYATRNTTLTLPAFLELVTEIRAAGPTESIYVTVFSSVADGRVTRILLHVDG